MTESALLDLVSGARVPLPMIPFAEVLGVHDAAALCLIAGGSRVSVPKKNSAERDLARLVGADLAARLSEAMAGERIYVPLARGFLIPYLRARGWTVPSVARALRCSEKTVYQSMREASGQKSGPRTDE